MRRYSTTLFKNPARTGTLYLIKLHFDIRENEINQFCRIQWKSTQF